MPCAHTHLALSIPQYESDGSGSDSEESVVDPEQALHRHGHGSSRRYIDQTRPLPDKKHVVKDYYERLAAGKLFRPKSRRASLEL